MKFDGVTGFATNVGACKRIVNIDGSNIPSNANLTELFKKYGNREVTLNEALIDDDLEKLKQMRSKYKNKKLIESCENVEKYLKELKKNGCKVKCEHKVGKDGIETKLAEFPELGVDATSYIEIEGNAQFIDISFKRILDAMALEMAAEDLGLSHKMIEEELVGTGLVSAVNNEVLNGMFEYVDAGTDGMLYLTVKNMAVDKSRYINKDENIMYDFFGGQHHCEGSTLYRDALESSVKDLMKIVVKELLELIDTNAFGFKLLAVNDGTITLLREGSDSDINDIYKQSYVLKMFNRRFRFVPEINVIGCNL